MLNILDGWLGKKYVMIDICRHKMIIGCVHDRLRFIKYLVGKFNIIFFYVWCRCITLCGNYTHFTNA